MEDRASHFRAPHNKFCDTQVGLARRRLPLFRRLTNVPATERTSWDLDQIGITLSGVIAVWLTQDMRATWRRWACIFGMLAQPLLVLRGMEGGAARRGREIAMAAALHGSTPTSLVIVVADRQSQPWRRCRHCMVTPELRATLVATGVRRPQGVHLPPSLPLRVRLPIYSLLPSRSRAVRAAGSARGARGSRLGVGAWLLQDAPLLPMLLSIGRVCFNGRFIVAAWTQAGFPGMRRARSGHTDSTQRSGGSFES